MQEIHYKTSESGAFKTFNSSIRQIVLLWLCIIIINFLIDVFKL